MGRRVRIGRVGEWRDVEGDGRCGRGRGEEEV